MIERGLLVADEIVPGTDWITRDTDYFWTGGRGTRPRASLVDLSIGHWTAGEAGTRDPDGAEPLTEYDDDGPRIVRVMRARVNPVTGKPLNCGITFVIGACDPHELYANCWQTMDPGRFAPVQVGTGAVNRRSIGTEVVSAGLPGTLDLRKRPITRVPLLGGMKTVLKFFPGQLRTWVRLQELLASLDGRGGIRIPRRVPSFGATRRFTDHELAQYGGALEHVNVPGTTKIDAAGMLITELAGAGWLRP